MSSKSTSKWSTNDDDEAEAEAAALRRKEKEEKRRLKEEKARKAAAAQIANAERPSKRQRTSEDGSDETPGEGANLLQFPARQFGSCAHVEQFEMLNNIEEGSYGLVSRARRKATGQIVALKRLKMDYVNDGFPVTGLREIQTLKACSHPHVVELIEVVMGDSLKDVYLVMDFLEHDLKTLLEDMAEPFLPSETKTLMLQLVSATSYLHENWILHRDLKTSNLLLNNRGEIKLADFGMARYTGNPRPKLTQLVVTLWYRAPELLLGTEAYDSEIDVWSLGCIFAELLTKDPLFQGKNEVDQLSKIFALLGTPTNETWPGFRSLPNAKALHPVLSKSATTPSFLTASKFPYLTTSGLRLLSSMLSMNPAGRPSAPQILRHPYFKEDPRPKAKEMFPTFPSKAGQEKRRRRITPQAPGRGDVPKLDEQEFAGIFAGRADEEHGAGFSLRLG
ncbi:CMGC/CDK protein kinase [Exophiala aquamarina CBS 119918]|uniref:cyclin-dependent kinase n=1 Tax=Exophiala aquamarina CBS 119918 TaxID=1182545 RepID=A0A072P580_9EURO|nr:CMGC/CDK protein kinase [Exophiala aquamarina CBS 119918]KEF55026.1 CMGC/CDK protein kinase [Exophiala aquamarina CBS 119918]